jgi:hypothetical protein
MKYKNISSTFDTYIVQKLKNIKVIILFFHNVLFLFGFSNFFDIQMPILNRKLTRFLMIIYRRQIITLTEIMNFFLKKTGGKYE